MTKKYTQELCIERFKNTHGDTYDYSNVIYKGKAICVNIICHAHGLFKQRPASHWNGAGCDKCANADRGPKPYTFEDFIKRSNELHKNYYDYSKVAFNRFEKAIIICPIHGEFKQFIGTHLRGCGCPKCGSKRGNLIQHVKTSLPKDVFIERSNIMHNNFYSYENLSYNNISEKVKIICPVHGEFEQIGFNHLAGRGCKLCGRKITRNSLKSKNECKLFNTLKLIFPNLEQSNRKILEGYELDIVNNDTKRAIEFNGDYWHCNPNKYDEKFLVKQVGFTAADIWKHDKMKINFAKHKGYEVLTIWESEFKNTEDLIIDKCITFLKGNI